MSIFIDTLRGQKTKSTPVWLMRQAGRHLPEYINIRKRFNNLMDMFLDPPTIAEVSMQPVNRYKMDACIVFSDILMTPFATGSDVKFVEGQGPLIKLNEDIDYNHKKTLPLATGIKKIKESTDVPLIGFAGGAWTTLFYCLFTKGERRELRPDDVSKKTSQIDNLIERMTCAIIQHSEMQIDSGVDAFQIFESAAGHLNDEQFYKWCVQPTKKIVESIKKRKDIPIIGFPRNANLECYKNYSHINRLDCITLDYNFNLDKINELNNKIVFQGNMNPNFLLRDSQNLGQKIDEILFAFRERPHIFNLGHGVLPETSIEKVEEMLLQIRSR
jgi:uroporphyrinogen decarboxylase